MARYPTCTPTPKRFELNMHYGTLSPEDQDTLDQLIEALLEEPDTLPDQLKTAKGSKMNRDEKITFLRKLRDDPEMKGHPLLNEIGQLLAKINKGR
jgi:hypothetical protein